MVSKEVARLRARLVIARGIRASDVIRPSFSSSMKPASSIWQPAIRMSEDSSNESQVDVANQDVVNVGSVDSELQDMLTPKDLFEEEKPLTEIGILENVPVRRKGITEIGKEVCQKCKKVSFHSNDFHF